MNRLKDVLVEAQHLVDNAKREGYWLALRDSGTSKALALGLYRSRWGDDPSADMIEEWERDV